jgi:hypothetical protein
MAWNLVADAHACKELHRRSHRFALQNFQDVMGTEEFLLLPFSEVSASFRPSGSEVTYSGHKITERLGNVTVRREKAGKSKGGERLSTVCLSMYSITENIYYSQLPSVAILLQPDLTVSHRIIQGNDCVSSPSVLSSFGLPLPPTCLLLTASEARSYFASTITTVFIRMSRESGIH